MTWYRRSSRFVFDALFRRRRNAGGATTITCSSSRINQPWLNIHDGSKRRSFFQRNSVRSRLLGLGYLGLGVYYYSNLERVPFTNRSHFMIYPTSLEKSENRNRIKSKYKGKILPPDHPSSIRVRRIGQRILGAAQKGLRLRKNNECIPQFDWEFLVVDKPIENAYCHLGGKIVVCTGYLLNKSDAGVAVSIGHEVGHAIARHNADNISKLKISKMFLFWSINLHLLPAISKFLGGLPYSRRHSALLCRVILMLFLYLMANLSLIPAILKFLIKLPNSRRNEKEADYIGLILMALAGYDPRVSVELREKQAEEEDDVIGWSFEEYASASTHPSFKKRAQLLSQPKVMEEALSLYRVALRQRRAAQFHAHRAESGFQRFCRQNFRSFLIRDRV